MGNDECGKSPEPCASDWDCSLAGICNQGTCECDAWAWGHDCSYINLQPVNKHRVGYVDPNTSSWGGNMVYNEADNLWYMYVAEIACTPDQIAAGQNGVVWAIGTLIL